MHSSRRVSRSTTREDWVGTESPPRGSSSAVVSAEDVARLVQAGAPYNELVSLALVQANKQAVREGGGVEPIVSLLPACLDAAENAATADIALTAMQHTSTVVSALWSLAAHSTANQDAIRVAGGVPMLVAHLTHPSYSGSPELAGHTAGALWSLASNNTLNQHAVREAGGVGALITLLQSAVHTSPDAARHAVRHPPLLTRPFWHACILMRARLFSPSAA